MGKPSNKKRGKLSPMSQFELRSFQTKSSTTITGGYRDAIDSEYDFEIEGQEEFEAVSDITVITRAVDVDTVDQSPQDPKRFRLNIFVPCLLFFLSLLAVAFARGKGGIDNSGIHSSRTRTPGSENESPSTSTSNTNPAEGGGRVIEFTVANLNTNAQNCTHVKDSHDLQCIPYHNNATNKFRIQLRPEWAPLGVERFEYLTTSNFWQDVRVFRIVPNFISQFGISSYPKIQKDWSLLGSIQDDPVITSNDRGTVSFATSGKNTRTTQVFINTADNWYLDDQGFAPIGEVLPAGEGYGGMEVVDEFYAYARFEPDQLKIRKEGKTYLEEEFPLLSYFVKAEFLDQDEIFQR